MLKTTLQKHGLMAATLGLAWIGLALTGSHAWAYAPEGDLMKVKGYSPEVIQLTNHQRSRQEWKEASAPKTTPMEQFFHNVYYGNWTDSIDTFGAQVIRDN